jgi:hypothetical protein
MLLMRTPFGPTSCAALSIGEFSQITHLSVKTLRRYHEALVACGGSGNRGGDTAQSMSEQAQFNPQPYENVRDGGTLTTALPEITPQFNTFEGIDRQQLREIQFQGST